MLLYALGASLNLFRADALVYQWSGVMFVGLVFCLLLQLYLFCFMDSGSNEEETNGKKQ